MKVLYLKTWHILGAQEMMATFDVITTYFVAGRVLGLQATEVDVTYIKQKEDVYLEVPESRSWGTRSRNSRDCTLR